MPPLIRKEYFIRDCIWFGMIFTAMLFYAPYRILKDKIKKNK